MFQEIQQFKRRKTAGDADGLPLRRARFSLPKLKARNWLFVLTVILPTAAAALYYGFFASNVYVSESKFVVRSPDKPAMSGLGVILKSAGFANSGDELYAAQSFATSRDALRALNRGDAFKKAFTRPGISIADRFDPMGFGGTFEGLYRYFLKRVSLQDESSSSITTLTVRAYAPQDAYRFNQQLLEMSEAMVNRLNSRGREDLVHYAQAEVDHAKASATASSLALAAFRNRSGIVDPDKQATAQMSMISKLQDNLIAAKTELSQLVRFTPENPRIPVVRTELGTIQGEIDRELGKVAGNRGSLAASAVQFQRLTIENDFAGKQLTAALAAYEEAKSDTQRKQAYVERIVQPNLPDDSTEPRRLRGILSTLVLGLVAFGILRMLLAGVKEHAQ